MKILVTGAAGFIGYHLVKRLIEQEDVVLGLDNINDYYDINLKYGRLSECGIKYDSIINDQKIKSGTANNYSFQKSDITDLLVLEQLFAAEQFDYVVHMAAQPGVRYSLENPHAYIQSNVVGFMNILECCRRHNIKHLVYASSSSIYGMNDKIPFSEDDKVDHPVSIYAATKKSNELMAHTYSHLYGLPTTGLRFFTVYGPWGRPDMAPMLFADAISRGRPIKVFNHGEMSRDFTYIDDIVQGIILSLKNKPAGALNNRVPYQLFNIGNGAPVSLMMFIETLEMNLEKEAQKNMLPMQPGDVPRTWANTNYLNQIGYQSTTSIQEGIKKFVDWYKVFYNR